MVMAKTPLLMETSMRVVTSKEGSMDEESSPGPMEWCMKVSSRMECEMGKECGERKTLPQHLTCMHHIKEST